MNARGRWLGAGVMALAATAAAGGRGWGATVSSGWTNADATGLWNDPLNWSPNVQYPDNGLDGGVNDYVVTIGAPTPTVLNVNVTVDSVAIGSAGELSVSGGDTLMTTNSGSITNGGLISVSGNTSLLGLVTANLQNSGTIEAGAGATVSLALPTGVSSGTITNAGGVLSAADGGTLDIQTGYTISDGSFNTAGTGTIKLNTDTLSNITVTAGAQIEVFWEADVTVAGPAFTNNGTITLQQGFGAAGATVTFSGNTTLEGTGSIVGVNGTVSIASGQTLTQAAGHSITGFGTVTGSLDNQGIINANMMGTAINVSSPDLVNTGTLEASNGGTLNLSCPTSGQPFVNAGGTVLAEDGSTVSLGDFAISGGTLQTSGSGVILAASAQLSNVTVAAGADVSASGEAVPVVVDQLTDNGLITVSHGGFFNGEMDFSSTGNSTLLTGTGQIVLSGGSVLYAYNGVTLTQDTQHTISGTGTIAGTFVNNGTINANSPGNTLTIQNTLTNGGTLEATGGGVLQLGGAVTNAGSLVAEASSNITIAGQATNNGALTVDTGGSVSVGGAITGTGNASVSGTLTADAITQNALTISGAVTLRPPADGGETSVLNALTLTGAGSLNLGGNALAVAISGPSTLAALRSAIAAGNIVTGSSALVPALIDNSSLADPYTTFGGVAVPADAAILAPALLGDVNLDGVVDLNDLNLVLNNLGTSQTSWTAGNMDGGSTVDLNDLNDVLNHLGVKEAGALAAGGGKSVPEPGSLLLMGAGWAAVMFRRRRRG